MSEQESQKVIISANEISTYLFCPKCWELLYLKKVKSTENHEAKHYKKLRQAWLADFDLAVKFTWASRFILFLIVFLLIFYVLINMR